MERTEGDQRNKRLIWGLFLIALGGAFLLERFGVIGLPGIGEIWPAVFLVIAVTHAAAKRFGSALMFLLMGCWFFAVEYGWMGLTYRNSWPLMLVGVGLSIVIGALLGEPTRWHRREGARHE